VRQEDARKPVILLTTLLVADSTGMCKLTVWDEAVLSFNNISEGDQILLAGRYKVGFYNDKYLLEPKVRLSVPRVKIELKLNTSDLKDVYILDQAVGVGLPPPVWNFYTVGDLRDNKVPSGRIVDVLGVVLHHGRWERESCTEPNSNSLTGQFWIRIWLKLIDHTCISNTSSSLSQNQTENFVWIKMYVDLEKYDSLQSLLPQVPAVITNVLSVYSGDQFSHLESSNETQVFGGDQAFSSRFLQTSILEQQQQKALQKVINKNNVIIEEFRKSWDEEDMSWSEVFDVCSLGGNSIPLRQIKTMFSLSFHVEVVDFLQGLPYLTGARVMIKGKPALMKEYSIKFNGSIELVDSVLCNQENHTDSARYSGEDLLQDVPCLLNTARHPLDMRSTGAATSRYCFLSLEKNRDPVDTVIVPQQVLMVLIQSRDYRIWVEAPPELKQEFANIKETNQVKFCVDFFRYEGSESEKASFCNGVEATLRRIYTVQQQEEQQLLEQQLQEQQELKQQQQQAGGSGVNANQTLDFISAFN
jgi:hypothetical protein